MKFVHYFILLSSIVFMFILSRFLDFRWAIILFLLFTIFMYEMDRRKTRQHKIKSVLNSQDYAICAGSVVVCINPLDELTKGQQYVVEEVLPSSNRVKIYNDQGKECHARADRFELK